MELRAIEIENVSCSQVKEVGTTRYMDILRKRGLGMNWDPMD